MALGVGCTFYVTPPEMCPVWPFQARSLRLNRRLSCSRSLVTCWPRESRAAPSPGSALPSRTEPVCLLGVTVPGQHEGLPARKTLPRVTIQRQGAGLGPLPIDPPHHILRRPGHRGPSHCFSSPASLPSLAHREEIAGVPFPLPVWRSFLVPAQVLNRTGYLGLFSPHPRTAHDLRLLALAGDIITDEHVSA